MGDGEAIPSICSASKYRMTGRSKRRTPSDLTPNFHPLATRDRRVLLCTPSLDHPKVEFAALFHGDGLGAPSGLCSDIGTLLPKAPCGRTSL